MLSLFHEEPLPCHSTINYEDKTWKSKWMAGKIGNLCRGALILAANTSKLARNKVNQPKVPCDHENVFSSGREFIQHHESGAVHSWEFAVASNESNAANTSQDKCYFCDEPCTVDDFCYGCDEHVCEECSENVELAPDKHDVDDHRLDVDDEDADDDD